MKNFYKSWCQNEFHAFKADYFLENWLQSNIKYYSNVGVVWMCLLRSFPNCREVVDISMTPKDLWNYSMIDNMTQHRILGFESYLLDKKLFVVFEVCLSKLMLFSSFFQIEPIELVPIPAMTYIFMNCTILCVFISLCGCLGCNHVLICSQKVQNIMYE